MDAIQAMNDWDTEFGDCKQELVFIGQEMDSSDISEKLDGARLTETELEYGMKHWATKFTDPFPDWPIISMEELELNKL